MTCLRKYAYKRICFAVLKHTNIRAIKYIFLIGGDGLHHCMASRCFNSLCMWTYIAQLAFMNI